MKLELFSFQQGHVVELRTKVAEALGGYGRTNTPQVVSLQAPTGAGKTIIMAAFMEDVYCGTDKFVEQPNAIFVWLSDSPSLNEQSRKKIEAKADKIKINQCVTIDEASFDMEVLEDGKIYFLNTQKISKAGNLSSHRDMRDYTIWETLENTVKTKADRLYFIIDEAHRGMQGRQAGEATSIMQRFLKGSTVHKLSPMPVVIGMSATAERFNKLVEGTTSTMHRVVITPTEVRASGLLKDRIVVKFPSDRTRYNDMAILEAAADEWKNKCDHWHLYCYEQHYSHVNPIFVVQVEAGSGTKVSNTDLDDVVRTIENRLRIRFAENEVVHTFGSVGELIINGLNVPHVEPDNIADDKRIKVVLFKENLSTGWDCPRAETMMSFRTAEDATYVAQLLGRMVRTPKQCHIEVDETLNDVHLYLPYFDRDTVERVVQALRDTEGGDIPTVIDPEAMEEQLYGTYTVHVPYSQKKSDVQNDICMSLFNDSLVGDGEGVYQKDCGSDVSNPVVHGEHELQDEHPQAVPLPTISKPIIAPVEQVPQKSEQLQLPVEIDREGIIKYINTKGFLKHSVRSVQINNYLKSLLALAGLLTRCKVYTKANEEIHNALVDMAHSYIVWIKDNGKYEELAKQVVEFKLSSEVFNVFGEFMKEFDVRQVSLYSDSNLDSQLRIADNRLGGFGFSNKYFQKYGDDNDFNRYKIESILFANNDDCYEVLLHYAKDRYHALVDEYREELANKDESWQKEFNDIVRNGDAVSVGNLKLPETISLPKLPDGKDYYNHLYADAETGIFNCKLNGWEETTLKEEMEQNDFVCWLRNPSQKDWALSIAYEIDGTTKQAYPDFIIVRRKVDRYVVDILEPHDSSRKDNLNKAKGFVKYAQAEKKIGRLQLIREKRDYTGVKKMCRLDLAKSVVQEKVMRAINNNELDHIFDTDGEYVG